MIIPLSRKFNGKKFLWDGATYGSRDEAAAALEAYQKDGFEVELLEEEGRYLVYSRRVAATQSGE
ncbi:MAG: hypothetical protein AB1491_06465 [Thermodesulfobacteriota bacterium]